MRRLLGWLSAGVVVAAGVFGASAVLGRASSASVPAGLGHEPGPIEARTLHEQAHVILITLDGVRPEEAFDDDGTVTPGEQRPLLARTRAWLARGGVALRGRITAAWPRSLPGYEALALGHRADCDDNDCARVEEETMAEAIARRLQLAPAEVAVFASWSRLARAATARDGSVMVDAPADTVPVAGGPPWKNARFDVETIERALAHWDQYHPRFLHLALLDTDEEAHEGSVEGTVRAAQLADRAIDEVMKRVAQLPEGERALTTVLVTTDHGRAAWPFWKEHTYYPAAAAIWLVALGPLVRGGAGTFTHADVRPTVDRLLGLCPGACQSPTCGDPLPSVVGTLPCAEPAHARGTPPR